ncbi:MAG: Bug family tripartite tricarboxylate transporter substrate binding protein [Burkholderiales bacterium]
MVRSRIYPSVFASLALLTAASFGHAQDYPSKPIRIITASLGGVADVSARLLAQGVSGALGQQIIIENRGGETLAIEAVARARPDGYTLLVYGTPLWLTPLMRPSAPFDWERDFIPITLISTAPLFLYAHPTLAAASIKELIALARAKPGEINYGTSGTGSATHLVAELFKTRAGVDITRIPYKGGSLAANALLTGEIQLYFGSAAVGMQHVKAGKLRALGVASLSPAASAPDIPTIASAGLPGFEAEIFNGVWAPAKTPADITGRLNQEMGRALHSPEIKERLANIGMISLGGSPEQLVAKARAELATLGKVIKDLNIRDQ